MRIIAGKYKKRNIKYIKNDYTRPTTDKVREAIFNIISPYIKNYSTALDLFAGTGSFGLECLSRGFDTCYFIDNNKIAINIINENLKILNEKNGIVVKTDYIEALRYFNRKEIKFDLVFLDPPYKFSKLDLILNNLIEFDLLNNDAIIILEHLKEKEIINKNYELLKKNTYGIRTITILNYNKEVKS